MERTGSTGKLRTFLADGLETLLDKQNINASELQKAYEKSLSKLVSHLNEVASMGDSELSLAFERACINFDSKNHMTDRKRTEKDLSQSIAAEKSLEFLKTDPQGYRKKINEVFPNGIKKLPEGDAYIIHVNTQIRNLGLAKAWMSTPAEIAYLDARQDSLKAGRKGYQTLQKNALFTFLS
ncbi:hypothetical protein LJC47_01055 [Desulfosarcina sp. OttesenSCG-928-B08]|nr:hypothetical protein [Desulfosarcina sp. OttesenSCG-928-B08]